MSASAAGNQPAVVNPTPRIENYLSPVVYRWDFDNPFYRRSDLLPRNPLQSVNFTYGPFSIGHSKWQLELRLPSYGVHLKRLNGIGKEHLRFRLEENRGFSFPIKCFTFTGTKQEVRVGACDPAVAENYAKLTFNFAVFVRPENYAGGLPCNARVVVLERGGRQLAEYAAHRSILSVFSPVFRQRLLDTGGEIRITIYSPDTVRALLDFIYTGQVHLDGRAYQEAMDLLAAVENFRIERADILKLRCARRLVALINCENALALLALTERNNFPGLKQRAIEFINENRREIVRPGPNDAALKRLSPETLVRLLHLLAQN